MQVETAPAKSPFDVWWTMHGQDFLDCLVRAFEGEDPEMLYMEWYFNSERRRYDANGNEIT